jgi:hypothetical protein
MGGFFGGGTPSVPTYTAPAPVPATDPEAEARKQREEAMARNRRGRSGMVATSERGVLSQGQPAGKSLLGE